MRVKLLQDSSEVGTADDPVGFWLVSDLGSPLGELIYFETWPLQLIVDILPGLI